MGCPRRPWGLISSRNQQKDKQVERGQESRHTPLRLIERVASYLTKANPALAGEQETAADPRGTISQHIGSVSIGGNVLFGMVVDYVPYTRLYKVLIENGKAPIDCYRLLETGGTPIGIADCSNLQVNTPVYVILHPKQKSGYIIGVEPPFMFDARRGMSDVIHQASCCGLHVDAAHQFPAPTAVFLTALPAPPSIRSTSGSSTKSRKPV
jgi:hypothetical protein